MVDFDFKFLAGLGVTDLEVVAFELGVYFEIIFLKCESAGYEQVFLVRLVLRNGDGKVIRF